MNGRAEITPYIFTQTPEPYTLLMTISAGLLYLANKAKLQKRTAKSPPLQQLLLDYRQLIATSRIRARGMTEATRALAGAAVRIRHDVEHNVIRASRVA